MITISMMVDGTKAMKHMKPLLMTIHQMNRKMIAMMSFRNGMNSHLNGQYKS